MHKHTTHVEYDGMICQQDRELVKPVRPLPLSFSITTKGAERAINSVMLCSQHGDICDYVSSMFFKVVFVGVCLCVCISWVENMDKGSGINCVFFFFCVLVCYLLDCPHAWRAYPHLHPGWSKTANTHTYIKGDREHVGEKIWIWDQNKTFVLANLIFAINLV